MTPLSDALAAIASRTGVHLTSPLALLLGLALPLVLLGGSRARAARLAAVCSADDPLRDVW